MERIVAEMPIADQLKDPERIAAAWPEEAPALIAQARERRALSDAVRDTIVPVTDGTASAAQRERLSAALRTLLRSPGGQRLALYLPFQTLPERTQSDASSEALRQVYLETWDALLSVQDVRANFLDGDVAEKRAAAGPPERVVKAAHLAPFLVQRGLLSAETLAALLRAEDEPVLCWSLIDAVDAFPGLGLAVPEPLRIAREDCAARLPERFRTPEPCFVTPARAAWLREKAQGILRPETPTEAELAAPLSTRMDALAPEIRRAAALAAALDDASTFGVVFLGGSRLKGYGRPDSDVDLCVLTRAGCLRTGTGGTAVAASVFEQPEQLAHAVFHTVWVGTPERIAALRHTLGMRYFAERDAHRRALCLERLEQDLLQYRLMHKGYPRLYPDSDPAFKRLTSVDGASAFYERDYRVIASRLFADNVFLPVL